MASEAGHHVPGRHTTEAYAQALRDELEHLWSDLAQAYRLSHATPPEQSMGCLGLIGRIQTITDHVGPCPPEKISMPFLLTGMYEQVHAAIGVTAPVPEEAHRGAREYVAGPRRRASVTDHRAEATERARRYVHGLNAQQRYALSRHGYDPDLPPRGVSGPPGAIKGARDICLRNHVCELDGVEIDGHGGTDLTPGSTSCIYCDYERPNP